MIIESPKGRSVTRFATLQNLNHDALYSEGISVLGRPRLKGRANWLSSDCGEFGLAFQKLPEQFSWPQSQSSSIVSPVPSHEALQYLVPSVAGQLQVGFLQIFSFSSAIEHSSN